MIKDTDIAWISGLIDGEGCFMFNICLRKNRKKTKYIGIFISPHFTISMLPGIWENKFKQILSESNILYCCHPHRHMTCIRINGDNGVKKLCNLIHTYSEVKKPLINMFLNYTGRSYRNQHKSINEKDIRRIAKDVDFAREFNKKHNKKFKWTGKKILEFYGFSQ